jgi:hypothetical protein
MGAKFGHETNPILWAKARDIRIVNGIERVKPDDRVLLSSLQPELLANRLAGGKALWTQIRQLHKTTKAEMPMAKILAKTPR